MYRIIIDGQYVPIPPEKITIKVDGDNKTMTLINLGEINVIIWTATTKSAISVCILSTGIYDSRQLYKKIQRTAKEKKSV